MFTNKLSLLSTKTLLVIIVLSIVLSAFIGFLVWLQFRPGIEETRERTNKLVVNSQFESAISIWEDFSKQLLRPDNEKKWAYLEIGSLYTNLGDKDRALDSYKKAEQYTREVDPNLSMILASAYMQRGDKENALEYLKQTQEELDVQDPLYDRMKNDIEKQIKALESHE
jgi:tetratricopeptide (TPR) repeat protein